MFEGTTIGGVLINVLHHIPQLNETVPEIYFLFFGILVKFEFDKDAQDCLLSKLNIENDINKFYNIT